MVGDGEAPWARVKVLFSVIGETEFEGMVEVARGEAEGQASTEGKR